jgi:hypothetical protein
MLFTNALPSSRRDLQVYYPLRNRVPLHPLDKQTSSTQRRPQTMPIYPDEITFLSNGLDPYIASPPSTPRPTPHSLTSGPLFHSTPFPTEPLANASPPIPSPSPTLKLPPTCPVCLSALPPHSRLLEFAPAATHTTPHVSRAGLTGQARAPHVEQSYLPPPPYTVLLNVEECVERRAERREGEEIDGG